MSELSAECISIAESAVLDVPMPRPRFSKQLSMKETSREAKWDKRRRQALERHCRMMTMSAMMEKERNRREQAIPADTEAVKSAESLKRGRSLTDEDLDELRGSIELGFGFSEEVDERLHDTLPALGFYIAVNRQFSERNLQRSLSSASTGSASSTSMFSLAGDCSPRGPYDNQQQSSSGDEWKICNPGAYNFMLLS